MVHYNLGKTLADVENIAALPAEAAEAEHMLKDDYQLIQATLHTLIMLPTPFKSFLVLQRWTI